jgi:hypothetical protein
VEAGHKANWPYLHPEHFSNLNASFDCMLLHKAATHTDYILRFNASAALPWNSETANGSP